MIKAVIAEDNQFMKRHLENMFAADERFLLCGSFRDAFEAEQYCRQNSVDIIILDVQTLHNHSGIAAGERLKKQTQTKVLIVTSLIDPQVLTRAKCGAADSLWYKDHGDTELMEVIEKTLAGEHIFPDSAPNVELKEMFSAEITPRQMEILRQFVKGMTYDEIAAEMKISKNGVRWNLDQIVEKGGFNNKHELLAAVIENKLIVTTLKE